MGGQEVGPLLLELPLVTEKVSLLLPYQSNAHNHYKGPTIDIEQGLSGHLIGTRSRLLSESIIGRESIDDQSREADLDSLYQKYTDRMRWIGHSMITDAEQRGLITPGKKRQWERSGGGSMPQDGCLWLGYLDHNQFTGRIPDAFYKHTFLKEMYIEGNAFRPGMNPIGVHNVLEVSDTEFLF
ncbi:unnamed protein product [Camellia sinensis]